MSNYLYAEHVDPPVMAATTDTDVDPRPAGVGMAHLTVVPANFDREDESESDH